MYCSMFTVKQTCLELITQKYENSAPPCERNGVLSKCFFACALLVCCFSSSLFFAWTHAVNQINKLPTLKPVRKLPELNTENFHWAP